MKIVAATVAALLASTCCQAAEPAPLFTVTLKPEAINAEGIVPAVDVGLSVEGLHVAAGATLLQLPIVSDNAQTSALSIGNMSARDAKGDLVGSPGTELEFAL